MFLSLSNPLACDGMLHPLLPSLPLPPPPSFLIPMLCVFVRAFVGVCSAWAVGGVVVMESVLCDLWAGLQDANQEVCERRRGRGLWTARHSDQTLQHSSVSWLVPSPFTWYTQSLSLCLSACSSMTSSSWYSFSSKSQKSKTNTTGLLSQLLNLHAYAFIFCILPLQLSWWLSVSLLCKYLH